MVWQDILSSLPLSPWKRYQWSTIVSMSLSILAIFRKLLRWMNPLSLFVNSYWCTKHTKWTYFPFGWYATTSGATASAFPFPENWQIAPGEVYSKSTKVTSLHMYHWKGIKSILLFHIGTFENLNSDKTSWKNVSNYDFCASYYTFRYCLVL